jgi:hypothetical protein
VEVRLVAVASRERGLELRGAARERAAGAAEADDPGEALRREADVLAEGVLEAPLARADALGERADGRAPAARGGASHSHCGMPRAYSRRSCCGAPSASSKELPIASRIESATGRSTFST